MKRKTINKVFARITLAWLVFSTPLFLFAQTTIQNPIAASDFGKLVEALAKAITAIGIPLIAIFLVWSGFLFVTARGNEQQLQKAKSTLLWAVIGGAIIIGAWALSIAIVNFAKNLGGSTVGPTDVGGF